MGGRPGRDASGPFLIVVDSSVWIDFLNETATPQATELQSLIRSEHAVALTGLILTEVLQGLSSESEADLTADFLESFPFLPMNPPDYVEAARLFRSARNQGITISNRNDLQIAVPCIRENAWLLHRDSDFDLLATVSDLKIWQPSA